MTARAWALLLLAAVTSDAQVVPGRPPGTQRMPMPDGGALPFPTPRWPGRKPKTEAEEALQRLRGRVIKVDDKSLAIRLEDTRLIEYKLAKDTKFEQKGGTAAARQDIVVGMIVTVAGKEDDDHYLTARVVVLEEGPPAAASRTEEPEEEEGRTSTTEVARDGPDEYRPKLRRGKVDQPRAERDEAEASGPDVSKLPEGHPLHSPAPEAAAEGPAPPRVDPLIERARLEAERYMSKLPNFLCRQMVWRYQSDDNGANWSFNDMVTADVAYEDGAEVYRAIQVGRKKVEKFEDTKGAYSKGEFNTTLLDIFREQTAARFRAKGSEAMGGVFATVFDLEVDQPNSHWQIMQGSQTAYPSYHGSVSIDRKTGRVVKIVMKSETLPPAFPLRMVEQSVEYGMVRIGMEEFLLPLRAENKACWRNSFLCSNNRMEFRNYRRFAARSELFQTESKIEFEGEEKPQPKAKKK
ncbi:MAG: hypothetical protein SFV54_07285 [Bryobacteraceae bacterium]|nr:hypothetical protein [Bryobacteraceae bacterium]